MIGGLIGGGPIGGETRAPGTSAAPGVATEVDTALAPAAVQRRAAGGAVETSTALALSPGVPAGTAGVAVEVDTALAPPTLQTRGAGLALEINVGLALAGVQRRVVGRADELDTALQLSGGVVLREVWAAFSRVTLAFVARNDFAQTVELPSPAATELALVSRINLE